DNLPLETTAAVADSLVRSLDAAELRRAFVAAIDALVAEIERADADLAYRLAPPLRELARSEGSVSTTNRSRVSHLAEAQAGIPDSANKRSVRVLQRGTLDVVLGTPACPDDQTPHLQDEVYIVVRGRGVFCHDGKRGPFGPGDFLFVAAATEHRFEEF